MGAGLRTCLAQHIRVTTLNLKTIDSLYLGARPDSQRHHSKSAQVNHTVQVQYSKKILDTDMSEARNDMKPEGKQSTLASLVHHLIKASCLFS